MKLSNDMPGVEGHAGSDGSPSVHNWPSPTGETRLTSARVQVRILRPVAAGIKPGDMSPN